MNARQFFDLASDLRFQQTLYRYSGSLIVRARMARLEREIDKEITRVTHILRNQVNEHTTSRALDNSLPQRAMDNRYLNYANLGNISCPRTNLSRGRSSNISKFYKEKR